MATKQKKASRPGPRRPKLPSKYREIVAKNFITRLEFLYGEKSYDEYIKLTGLTKGTLQRALAGGSGLTLETLEVIARAAQMDVPTLLMPLQDAEATGELIMVDRDQKKLWLQFLQLRQIFDSNSH